MTYGKEVNGRMMYGVVGVTAHNAIAGNRVDLLEQTVRSIEVAFPTSVLCLLDNGSTDGTDDLVMDLCGERWKIKLATRDRDIWAGCVEEEHRWSPGMGRNRLGSLMSVSLEEALLSTIGSPIPSLGSRSFCVWSDDDMRWKEGAETKLGRFWCHERKDPFCHPTGVSLLSGYLEPMWHWNTPRRTVEHNGVKALVRDSAPGCAFSFINPRVVWPLDADTATFGYDHKTCKRIIEDGGEVAQLDLASHLGWGRSTHGNEAINHVNCKPLDRERWGV